MASILIRRDQFNITPQVISPPTRVLHRTQTILTREVSASGRSETLFLLASGTIQFS